MSSRPGVVCIGVVALVALAVEVLLLPRLAVVDERIWQATLLARGCAADFAFERLESVASPVVGAVLAAATAVAVAGRGVWMTWPPLAVCAVGLQVGRTMKDVFARERPSMLPDIALGHSFPSGHVINTSFATIAILILVLGWSPAGAGASRFRHAALWTVAALLLWALITVSRIAIGHHWFSDGLAGTLAALAFTALALPAFERRPLVMPAAIAIVLAAVLVIDLYVRPIEWRLPSPLVSRGATVAATTIGDTPLSDGWEAPSFEAPAGSFAWLRTSAMLRLDVPDAPPAAGARLADADRSRFGPAVLAVTGRPETASVGGTCAEVRVLINGRPAGAFVPFRGWRQYRLPLARDLVRPGPNEIEIAIAARDSNGTAPRFAVSTVALALTASPHQGSAATD